MTRTTVQHRLVMAVSVHRAQRPATTAIWQDTAVLQGKMMTVAKRTKRPRPNAELMQLADSLLTNYKKPEDLIGENGLLKQLTKMLVERAPEAEMAEHLGHDKSDPGDQR